MPPATRALLAIGACGLLTVAGLLTAVLCLVRLMDKVEAEIEAEAGGPRC